MQTTVLHPGLEPSAATPSVFHVMPSSLALNWTPLLAGAVAGLGEIDWIAQDGGGGVLIV
jgi:hypothetical protein